MNLLLIGIVVDGEVRSALEAHKVVWDQAHVHPVEQESEEQSIVLSQQADSIKEDSFKQKRALSSATQVVTSLVSTIAALELASNKAAERSLLVTDIQIIFLIINLWKISKIFEN